MAVSQTHFRSISLPSRLHPINPKNLETELEKLKSCQISSANNSEAIQSGLLMIVELYNSVQEITQTQKPVIHHDEKSIEESLSRSVELLDACSAIREVFQMIKENIQILQSGLRRKGMDSSVQNDIAEYFSSRKRMNKSIAKTLKTLKKSEQMMMVKNINGSDFSINAEYCNFTGVLREVMGITMAIFKSVLVLLSYKQSGWSVVSKLMISKSNYVVSEIWNVDFALSSIQGKMRSDGSATVVHVQKRLQSLGTVSEGFEGGFERLFRQLVQIRVTLLNILTNH